MYSNICVSQPQIHKRREGSNEGRLWPPFLYYQNWGESYRNNCVLFLHCSSCSAGLREICNYSCSISVLTSLSCREEAMWGSWSTAALRGPAHVQGLNPTTGTVSVCPSRDRKTGNSACRTMCHCNTFSICWPFKKERKELPHTYCS